jgi:hypothetical protein
MEAVVSSGTSMNSYRTTRRHIPEDREANNAGCGVVSNASVPSETARTARETAEQEGDDHAGVSCDFPTAGGVFVLLVVVLISVSD